MFPFYISAAPDKSREEIEVILPGSSGTVRVGLEVIEERPGGFYWLQVAIPVWYRNMEPDPPYTESVIDIEILTWVPVDSMIQLQNANHHEIASFLSRSNFPNMRFLKPGEGRPQGAPRFPFPWEIKE